MRRGRKGRQRQEVSLTVPEAETVRRKLRGVIVAADGGDAVRMIEELATVIDFLNQVVEADGK